MVTAAPKEPIGLDKNRAKVSVSPDDTAAEKSNQERKTSSFHYSLHNFALIKHHLSLNQVVFVII